MFDALSDKLQRVFSRLSSHGTVTEKDLDEALREVRVALLEADVNFRVVREFINAVRERAIGAEVLTVAHRPAAGHQDRQRRADEHARRQPGHSSTPPPQPPTVILLLGLKGAGKTTLSAKLALHLRKNGGKPLLVAADPYRVAAGEQLQTLGPPERRRRLRGRPSDVKKLATRRARRSTAHRRHRR